MGVSTYTCQMRSCRKCHRSPRADLDDLDAADGVMDGRFFGATILGSTQYGPSCIDMHGVGMISSRPIAILPRQWETQMAVKTKHHQSFVDKAQVQFSMFFLFLILLPFILFFCCVVWKSTLLCYSSLLSPPLPPSFLYTHPPTHTHPPFQF